RTYSAGVHAGTLKSQNGKEVTLTDARRLWYWQGAFTLNDVANKGIGKGSKIPSAVPEITLTEAIELIPCTDAARKSIVEFPEHQI
ncbi:MAG TPA: hypothetical protein VHB73_00915, partial [Alphaproteobacteria bacterium]|nr:hypothetical protein [Alphaproteobacteria bacterium]